MPPDLLDIQVTSPHGDVGHKMKDYAREKIAHVAKFVRDPILFARVKLTVEPDPARKRPAIAQATLDVNGVLVRAHEAGDDLQEAIDRLENTLRDKLEHLTERRQALRKRGPAAREPREWRHGDRCTQRPPYFDRPIPEREVVRHKTFALHALSPAEAADEMDFLGYDFHLFVCSETGEPSVIAHDADGRLMLSSSGAPPAAEDWFVLDPTPIPSTSEQDAIEFLNLTGRPYVFFQQQEGGQAAVLYRRYDGHYGLVTAHSNEPSVPT